LPANGSGDGGRVAARSGGSPDPVLISEEINNSNSGMAATLPIDPDDASLANNVADTQRFLKNTAASTDTKYKLYVRTTVASTITVKSLGVASSLGACNFDNKITSKVCDFRVSGTTLTFSNFSTKAGSTITNRKVCLPTDSRLGTPVPGGTDGATNETLTVAISSLAGQPYTLNVAVVAEGDTCPTGLSLTP
jgi:hypothetical protein